MGVRLWASGVEGLGKEFALTHLPQGWRLEFKALGFACRCLGV